jgi:hypothetical protein
MVHSRIVTDMGWATVTVRQAIDLGIPRQTCLEFARLRKIADLELSVLDGSGVEDDMSYIYELEADDADPADLMVARAVGCGTRAIAVLCLTEPASDVCAAEVAAIHMGLRIAAETTDVPAPTIVNDSREAVGIVREILGKDRSRVRWAPRGKVSAAHALTFAKANRIIPAMGYDARVAPGDSDGEIVMTHVFERGEGARIEMEMRSWAVGEVRDWYARFHGGAPRP